MSNTINTASNKRLRILHIISGDRWAGAEVQAFTLIKEQSKTHDLHAIILNHGELKRRLTEINIPVITYDECRQSSWSIFNGIKENFKSLAPEIIHTHRQKENILGSIANLLTIRVKCVRTIHGDNEFKSEGLAKIQEYVDVICGRYLQQGIIAVSEDLRLKLTPTFPLEKVFTITNGIDFDEVNINLQSPDFKQAMPDKKHIGIVGRLDPVKRVDIFLEMAKLLLNINSKIPWHFHVFGEGKLESEMKQLSKNLGICEAVTFHGHRMDVKNCIYGLDAVVMCSDHEGLPMTALESIAIGTPLLAHDTGGLSNLLAAHPEHLVVKNDPVLFATALNSMISHKTGKIEFPKNYKITNTARCMNDLYSSLL